MKEICAYSVVDKKIGKNLRTLRLLAGFSQEDVGHVLGVSYQQIQKYEQGVNRLSCPMLQALQGLYNVPYERFFEGAQTEKKTSRTAPFDFDEITIDICRRVAALGDNELKKKIRDVVDILAA